MSADRKDARGGGERVRTVVFTVAGERFALPAEQVEEVIDEVRPTRLPGLPPHVAGVFPHRGAWLPVLDPGPLLELPGDASRPEALVLRRGALRFAVLADHVIGLRDLAPGPDGVALDDGEPTAILEEDALIAAREDETEEVMPQSVQAAELVPLVVFRIGDDEFGVDVRETQEVLEYDRPAPVPGAPPFVEGVLALRGALLPIVDMRARLEVGPRPPDADARILVTEVDGQQIGLIVDSVAEVRNVPADAISPPPPFFRGLAAEYLHGLARTGTRPLVLLRLDRVLTAEERLALAAAHEEAAAGLAGASRAGDAESAPGKKAAPRRRAGGRRKQRPEA